VSDQIVEAASARVYVKTLEEFLRMRENRWEGEPPIMASRRRITSAVEVSNLFAAHKDDWYMQKGEAPVFEAGWEDLALRLYFPEDNKIRTIVPS
jgi:hypothetical protein